MMNKHRLKIVLILLSAVLIGALLGFGIYHASKKLSVVNDEKQIKEIVAKINEINNYFIDGLSQEETFSIGNNYVCKKYIGNDLNELTNKINDLYKDPYNGSIIYEDNELYVCMSTYCNAIVDIENYQIIDGTDGDKILDIENETSSYSIILEKVNKKWQLDFPIINCR